MRPYPQLIQGTIKVPPTHPTPQGITHLFPVPTGTGSPSAEHSLPTTALMERPAQTQVCPEGLGRRSPDPQEGLAGPAVS